MSEEDLMRPRYKVIAKWPMMPFGFNINEIYSEQESNNISFSYDSETMESYPHLFKKLEWWEEREESDMPEYVKRESGKIFQIDTPTKGMLNHHGIAYLTDRDTNGLKNFIHLHSTLPATKEEFLAHQNKKQ